MIKVYDSNERLFNNNGLKILHPLKAEVTKVDNGDYYVDLKDTIENLEYYQKGNIVRIPMPWNVQGFRCDNPTVKNNKVECRAWHLSYDSENYIIEDAYAVDKNCNDALVHFNDNTDITSPFTVISDVQGVLSTRAVRRTLYEVYEWLASEEKYNGHFYRDNWILGIKSKVGEDRGVTLAYNKNITDITVTENWDNVCTKILPCTTDGQNAITLDEVYVSLDKQLYDVPYTKIVEFDNELVAEDYETTDAFVSATKKWLRGKALEYLDKNQIPQVNYKISSNIDNISDVGDVIRVKHPKCKVDITTEVISLVYDAIRKKYINIEFGNFKNELKNFSQKITADIKAETKKEAEALVGEAEAMLQKNLESATATIKNVLGNSYVINEGDKILVVDRLPKETAVNVLMISNGGIGFSNSGINGTFSSTWTIDNQLNMANINVINLTASLIKGGTLKLGGANNSSGTFELYDEKNRLIAVMDKQGLTVYALNGDYVKLNADVGFAGYDRQGNKVYWADGDTFHMKNAEVENVISIAGKIKIVPVTSDEIVGIGFVAIS